MIKLLAFNKTYNKKKIISFDKLEFEDNGLYLIYGRSGCGKTTLLNCLSLLETFEGEYYFDGKQIKLCTEDEKTQIRKEKITYIHQKPVLLNEFSVFDNIKLFSTFKEGEILNYLSLFGLRDKKDVLVKFISGGEKQRLSIIKALILNKPIIFADEPTGSLDIENSKFVIKKLKELSKNQLVIVVSHDVNLFKSISDCIIEVKNKKIEIKKQKTIKDIKKKTHINNSDINKKELRKKFKKNIIKKKKIKNVLITIFTTLSLVCVSFTMLLSFNVKNSLIDGFSEFYEPNQLVIQNRTNNIITQKRNSPSNDEINKLEEILNSKSRIFYSTNFENFFKDANSLHLLLNYKTVKIEGYSARQFNEFKSIHVADTKYLLKNNLDDEEIVISIDNQMMLEFCFQLSITKSFQSLFNYIKNHDVLLSLFIKNFDWQYEDEQLFKLVGFVVEPERFIYHSNNLFSYLLFEEKMRLPSTIFDEIQDKPWYLKKEYIFEIDS